MRRELLTTTFALLTGISIGGVAMSLKHPTTSSAPSHNEFPAPVDTPVATEAKVIASLTDSKIEGAEPPVDQRDEDKDIVEINLGPMSEQEQMQVLVARWSSLAGEVNKLVRRIESLERRAETTQTSGTDGEIGDADDRSEVLPTDSPEAQRVALISAGVPADVADEVVWQRSQQQLARLELRDQAIREGWHQTERYADELRELGAGTIDLRTEIGTDAYDRYLHQTGAFNRVRIESVMQGSAAELSGLMTGDVIERYDGKRIFTYSDLRNATTQGARDEVVTVQVRRDETTFETTLARGPIGISLNSTSISPDG